MQLIAGLQTESISLRLAEAGQHTDLTVKNLQLNTQVKQLKSAAECPDIYLKTQCH